MGNKSRQHSTQDEAVKAGHSRPAAPPAHLRTPSWYQITYNLAASHANRALAQPREGGVDRRKDLIEAGHGGAEVAEAAAWAAKWSKGRPDQDWVGRLVYTRKPEPLRVRDQGFEHFLEETVEPCGLILWAGMLVELRSPDGATPDKSPEWKPRWRGDSGPFVFWTEPEALIQRVVKRPSLSYRAHYNLACFYADQQPD